MDVPTLAGALREAECESLPAPARAFLARRLLEHGVIADASGYNLGGLRGQHFGCRKQGPIGPARFSTLGEAARALVSSSYRAAPREWGTVLAQELAALGNYPIQREQPSATLGWIPGLGPSDAAEATYKGLVADWATFESLGVGTKILLFLREDLDQWRKFRQEWEDADIASNEIGGRLIAETVRSGRVRSYLADAKITDPRLQTPTPQAPSVTDAGGGLHAAEAVDDFAKRNKLLNWITDPAQPPGPAGAPPWRILGTMGVGIALSLALAFRLIGR